MKSQDFINLEKARGLVEKAKLLLEQASGYAEAIRDSKMREKAIEMVECLITEE